MSKAPENCVEGSPSIKLTKIWKENQKFRKFVSMMSLRQVQNFVNS